MLPIVQRELLVNARRPSTHWMRLGAAGVAIGILFLLLIRDSWDHRPQAQGRAVFYVISGMALVFCALAGVVLTAGSLCTERREGTLGLLFLTHLRSWDIVLGKLASSSAVAVYALVAVVPILSAPVLMGGVTGGEVFRMTLVLIVALGFSLATGLLASALCRDTRAAMGLTLAVQVALTGGLFLVFWIIWLLARTRWTWLMLPSPALAFVLTDDAEQASRSGAELYRASIGLIACLSVAQLAVAAVIVPRSWQDERGTFSLLARWRRAGPAARPGSGFPSRMPRPSVSDPGRWLLDRDRFPSRLTLVSMTLLFLIWTGIFVASVGPQRSRGDDLIVTTILMAFGMHLLVKLMMVIQATRWLGEERRSGALELLLVTPASPAAFLLACGRRFSRQFRVMTAGLMAMNVALFIEVIVKGKALFNGVTDLFIVWFLGGMVLLVADSYALALVGRWASLRARDHTRAVLWTVGRVLLAPWVLMGLFILVAMGGGAREETWVTCSILHVVLSLITIAVACARPRWELRHHFRGLVAGETLPRMGMAMPAREAGPG